METIPTDASSPMPDRSGFVQAVRIRRLLRWFIIAITLCLLCPAHTSVWWHIRHGAYLEWQGTRFKLLLAWSVPSLTVYSPGGAILERKSWFPFVTPATNSLYLNPPVPKERRDRLFAIERDSMTRMPWGPVSEFSRSVGARRFRCVTKPAPLHVFGFQHPVLQGPGHVCCHVL